MKELLTIAALAPGTNNMLRRVRVLRCCSEAEIIGNPPMAKPGYRWRVPAGLPVVHVKCSPVRLCHRHSAVRRARCSGRERPEWWCELHRQTVLTLLLICRSISCDSSGAMRIITSPDSRVPATAGWFIFIFHLFLMRGSFDELPRPGGSAQAGSANNAA